MPKQEPQSVSPGLAQLPSTFFHDVVSSLRNGVMVITADGVLAHMNREASRILALEPDTAAVGARYADVLRAHPDIIRVLRSAFELSNPPNRAELRLRPSGRVIGYTVCPVRDGSGTLIGATLLFKDLTRVEQLEERERLRDRLAALGEMAAAIAHEVKNPLAGIKVMAGLLRRRLAGVPDAESLLNDIITEAKMADAIVLEILDFVRPIRLQVERTTLARLLEEALQMADSLVDRRATVVDIDFPAELPPLEADANQLRQLFTNLLTNAFEALEGVGRISVTSHAAADGGRSGLVRGRLPAAEAPRDHRRQRPGRARRVAGPCLQSVLHDQAPWVRPGPGDRPQDRGCPRRPHRHGRRRRRGNLLPRHAADRGGAGRRQSVCWRFVGPDGLVIGTPLQGPSTMGRILIADDHDSLRRGLVRVLTESGHDVEEASNGNLAIEKLHEGSFDLVVSDLKMGGADGLDVLRTCKALHPTTAVILMTAFSSVHTAVEAMRIGAFDYVPKPFEIEEMEVKIEKAIEHRRLQHEVDYLRHTQQDIYEFDRIVGSSGALKRVLDIVRKVARSNTTVLIRGETGTGKELIAGAIHHNSTRATRNYVKVNCAALQENLLESELFGHEKGAFTGADKQRIGRFEQADGGTLFLDEVGDMSQNTQAKILRVLQEHEFERLGGTRTIKVDVRLITATNRNLAAMVAAGQFREDLYYRLNVVSIDMPPLRDRKEDIPALADAFMRRFAGELKKRLEGLQPDALKLLMRYNWPGNIRELENALERAALLTDDRLINAEDVHLGDEPSRSGADQAQVVKLPPTGLALEEIERQALVEALRMSNWVQKDAAELLRISPRVINYKIKTLGIALPRGRRHDREPLAEAV